MFSVFSLLLTGKGRPAICFSHGLRVYYRIRKEEARSSPVPVKDRKQIWSIPNLISLFRLLLIPLLVTLYWKGRTLAALAVFGVSAVSDIADGQIARRFNMVTDLGKMLDPLADKLTQGAAAVCVARNHPQVFLLFALMAVKELTQAFIGARSMKRTGRAFSARWYGKACTVITTACLMVMFAFPQISGPWINGMLLLCAVVMFSTLTLYANYFLKSMAAAAEKEEVS